MQTESSISNINARHTDPNTTAGATTMPSPSSSPLAAPGPEISCIPLINTIGLLFQILDDYLNLASPEYTARKGHAEDLTEGKFSFPVIHAIRSDPSNLVLLNVLRQKTTDLEVKRYAIEYMDSMGSFEYTKRVIAELEKKAVREVGRLEARIGGEAGKNGAERIRAMLGKLKAL
jgi:geranylgeranyl diphosphate synthase type 3